MLRVFVCCCSDVKGSRPTKAYPDSRVKADKVLQLNRPKQRDGSRRVGREIRTT